MATDRWCEHDEVAVECLRCKLRLAEATNELLTIRLQRLTKQLERTTNTVVTYGPCGAHWDGCEDSHPFCALVRDIRTLLQGENSDTGGDHGSDQ